MVSAGLLFQILKKFTEFYKTFFLDILQSQDPHRSPRFVFRHVQGSEIYLFSKLPGGF